MPDMPNRDELRILRAFRNHERLKGFTPTVRELSAQTGYPLATVQRHLKALVEGGYLRNRLPGAARMLAVTERGQTA